MSDAQLGAQLYAGNCATCHGIAGEGSNGRRGAGDIVGKGPDATATNPEVWEMMRSLLIERFHLKYHVEDREMAVLALTIAKGGPKLIPGEKGRCAEEIKQQRPCGDIVIPRFGAAMYNMPIGALVTSLTGRAGRPVVDKTGLTGRFDITLSFMPEGMTHEQWESLPAEGRPEDAVAGTGGPGRSGEAAPGPPRAPPHRAGHSEVRPADRGQAGAPRRVPRDPVPRLPGQDPGVGCGRRVRPRRAADPLVVAGRADPAPVPGRDLR